MIARSLHRRVSRWLVGLSLAMYAGAGLFGHALHELLPCTDEACVRIESGDGHCCHHDHAEQALAASHEDGQGSKASRPGHDPDRCSLCALLAKIAVGRVQIFTVELSFRPIARETLQSKVSITHGFDLTRAPRGPPLA
jgi:hypothetical protein